MNRIGSLVILQRLLCFLVVFATARPLAAQRAPQTPPPDLVRATSPYSPDHARIIQEYGTYWSAELTGGTTTGQVEGARDKLSGLLTGPLTPSALFRRQLGDSVIPALTPVITDEDLHKAVNALNVLSDLRSRQAARALQDQVNANQQSVIQIRIRAAKGLESTLDFASRFPALTDIGERDVVAIVQDLESAAGTETNPLVHRYLFEAIASAHAGDLDVATQQTVRDSLINAMMTVLGNAGNPKPAAGELEALYVGTNRLYAIYLQLNVVSPAAQRALGLRAATVIRALVESAMHSWEESRDDARLRRTFGQVLQLCEQFLRPIDASARPGNTLPNLGLRDLWLEEDQDAFNAAAQQVVDALSNPPYSDS